MKLFAQHGWQEGEKIAEGFSRGLLDGVIYSPRDVSLDALRGKLNSLAGQHSNSRRLFDPQYYANFLDGTDDVRLGYLPEDYRDYFQARRRGQLERETQVQQDLGACLRFQKALNVTEFIAPNIIIPNSLNSIETVIVKNFIRLTKEQHRSLNDSRPIYATLAISRNALADKQELVGFLNEITLLEDRPEGFYVLITARNTEARSDIYNADIIAAWMFINHVLTLNGYKVINGYSDILTPFLGAAGGEAGALGWWANLRSFSIDRFGPASGGGRLPIQRYLSKMLFNRITFAEFDQLRNLVPGILNNLPSDALYDPATGSMPQRNMEVIQSWDAVKSLNDSLLTGNQPTSLQNCSTAVKKAGVAYDVVQRHARLDQKSNTEHLQPLADGLTLFSQLAEL